MTLPNAGLDIHDIDDFECILSMSWSHGFQFQCKHIHNSVILTKITDVGNPVQGYVCLLVYIVTIVQVQYVSICDTLNVHVHATLQIACLLHSQTTKSMACLDYTKRKSFYFAAVMILTSILTGILISVTCTQLSFRPSIRYLWSVIPERTEL